MTKRTSLKMMDLLTPTDLRSLVIWLGSVNAPPPDVLQWFGNERQLDSVGAGPAQCCRKQRDQSGALKTWRILRTSLAS